MTPNLQFVDKGKVIAEFPAVAFQGGTIWVDERKPKNKELVLLDNGNTATIAADSDRTDCIGVIVAQSPDLNLESIPVVRVEEKNPLNSLMKYTGLSKDSILGKNPEHLFNVDQIIDFMKQYAAQSKGVYSEAQVREAIKLARREHYDGEDDFIPTYTYEQILASIQPKIVVECEPTLDLGKGGFATYKHGVKPITFKGEDGRTHFKIKSDGIKSKTKMV
jgi:hypothetical protein